MEQNQIQQPQVIQIPTSVLGAKFRNKKEIYFFLTVENWAYLPEVKYLSWDFLKDLFSRDKLVS